SRIYGSPGGLPLSTSLSWRRNLTSPRLNSFDFISIKSMIKKIKLLDIIIPALQNYYGFGRHRKSGSARTEFDHRISNRDGYADAAYFGNRFACTFYIRTAWTCR